MSYCRWSSDDFGCDLYCYESESAFVTHVASRRVIGDIPKHLPWAGPDGAAFFASHKAQMKFLETAEREPIGLAYDGETFEDPDLETFLETITMLRAAGYRVPGAVEELVREEIADELAAKDATPTGPKPGRQQ